VRRRWLAFALSFVVYALPLVGPHAAWLLGEALSQHWSSSLDERSVGWLVTDIGLALVLQCLTFAILVWALKRPLRLLVFVVVIPAMTIGVNVMYLGVIPAYFLIDRDTAPEVNTLTEHCAVPKSSLLPVRTPADLAALAVDDWWLQYPDGRYGLMRAADCSVTMAETLPQPVVEPGGRANFSIGLQYFVPGRGAIVERLEHATSRRTWWLLEQPDAVPRELPQPDNQQSPPILSNDGTAVVWMQDIPGTGPPVLTQLIVRSVGGDEPGLRIDLTGLGPASYVTAGFDAASRSVTLWRNDELMLVGFDGAATSTFPKPEGLRPQISTYRVGPERAWLAWDAYKDGGAYLMRWSTPAGQGNYTLTKGRSFTDAALEPSRGLIAISASTTLSIGSAPDLLAIMRASDGRDIFRKYLARYSRSPTVFFEGRLFGYSDVAGTHVVRLPS